MNVSQYENHIFDHSGPEMYTVLLIQGFLYNRYLIMKSLLDFITKCAVLEVLVH